MLLLQALYALIWLVHALAPAALSDLFWSLQVWYWIAHPRSARYSVLQEPASSVLHELIVDVVCGGSAEHLLA